MKSRAKIRDAKLFLLLVGSVLLVGPSALAVPTPVDRIIAVVNAEVVTASDLKTFSQKLDKSGMIDDLLLLGMTNEDLKKSPKNQVAYLINERLMESEIKKQNLTVTAEKVEQEIRSIAKRNNMSRDDLLNAVKTQGMKVSDYQDFIKNRIERQSLIEQEITSKIRVTDEDVEAQYIRLHPNLSTGVFEFNLANIVFNPKKGGDAVALEKANAALVRIRAGEGFDTVAEQTSEDPHFVAGGLLGTFKAGELTPDFESAVKNLKTGDVSNVVKSRGQYYILKVLGKKMTADPAFERDKEKIRGQLSDVAFQKSLRIWLEMKRDEAYVRINVPEYQ